MVPEHVDAIVRAARPPDVPAIEAVVDQSFAPYVERIGLRPIPMDADYRHLVGIGQVWVAELDEQVCGVIVLIPADDHLLLDVIGVSDRVRGRGVGALLMAFAEERACQLRLPEVQLYTNEVMTENLAYYPRRGYTEIGRETVAGIYHRVFFRKAV